MAVNEVDFSVEKEMFFKTQGELLKKNFAIYTEKKLFIYFCNAFGLKGNRVKLITN